jgi:hypothetical protein
MVILKFAIEDYENEIIATMENPLFIPRIGELVSYGREPSKEEEKNYNPETTPYPYLDCAEVVNISYDYDKDITIIVWF